MANKKGGNKSGNGAKSDWLGRIQGSGSEMRSRLAEDAKQRAEEGKRQGSIILNQKDVLTGQWDASKVLFTTLGGQLRTITGEDLQAFKYNIGQVQKNFTKGISAKQVIDLSLHEDRKRATDQIKMAVPVSSQNGKVRFITNAGPDSDVSRHHVIVEFMNYGAEASSGLTDPKKAAQRLRKGPLKFECDCGRHRFWYRYIATIGGFNAGRPETGYPKIRNPNLYGVGCKHVLRVMSDINSGAATLTYLTKLMGKAKASDEAKAALRQRQEDAEKIVQNQSRRSAEIKTSEQKRLERAAAKAQKEMTEKMKHATPPKKIKPASKKLTRLNDLAIQFKRSGVSRQAMESFLDMGAIALPKGATKAEFLSAFDAVG
jgi:hypothetical protein